MIRILLIIAFMVSLAACTTVDDPFLQTGALKADGPALATSVSPDYALAVVPGIQPVSVRQSLRENHIEQTVLYANSTNLSGENALTVIIGTGEKDMRRAPSQADVAAEMRTALSGVPTRISHVIADNAYGVFGYATGPLGKGGSCVYAWQLARSIAPDGGAGILGSGYAAHIRLRYCSPSMPQERIALLMQGLRIKPVSSQTFETLRFAAGTGHVSQAPLYAAEPVMDKIVVPDTQEAAATAFVHRNLRHVVVEETSSEPAEAEEKTIGYAVKVPMPGEAAILAANDTVSAVNQQVAASTAVSKPSLVPLPQKVAATAQ